MNESDAKRLTQDIIQLRSEIIFFIALNRYEKLSKKQPRLHPHLSFDGCLEISAKNTGSSCPVVRKQGLSNK